MPVGFFGGSSAPQSEVVNVATVTTLAAGVGAFAPTAYNPGDSILITSGPDAGRTAVMVAGATNASLPASWQVDSTQSRAYATDADRLARTGFTPNDEETILVGNKQYLVKDPANSALDEPLSTAVVALDDVWKSSAHANYETQGTVSWKQLDTVKGTVKTEFIFRTNTTQNAAPAATEFPNPTEEDAAIVILKDSRKEYYVYTAGAWAQRGSVAAAIADGRNFLASRSNATANVEPTSTEVPLPKSGDTAAIYLNSGNIEQWFHNGAAWSLVYTINPTTLDGNTVFVARTTATTGAAPTNTEVVAPANGDTAIVFLSNGLREYWSYGTAWTLTKTEGDSRSDFIFRTNATQNTPPTSTEFPNPINNDAAVVVLNDGRKEYYAYVSSAWVQRGAIAPFAVDGRCVLIPRTNATANTAPTTTEIASPKSGDTAIVFLTNGLKEYWSYGTAWTLTKTDGTLPPTSQHDFGLATALAISPTSGVQAHLEGGAGYTIVASTLPDNWECTLLNTTSAARTVTFSGFAGAYMRDGTGDTLTSPLSIPANSEYRLESVINGPNRWLNVIPQGGGGSAASGSVTAQAGSHAFNQTSTTNPSASFAVTFPQPFANAPTVDLTYQWNYSASTNGAILSPSLVLEAVTTTGFNYRINGSRNALDRVMWTAVDPLTTTQAGNTVLTSRAITGSITSTGYDGVTVPYQIPLAAGLVLDTVSLNGTPTTNFDANTGIVRITPSGGAVAVTHTTRAGATYRGLQRVDATTTSLLVTASNQNYTLGTVLQDGDLLEVEHTFNNNIGEAQSFWIRVKTGSTQRAFPWADPTNNAHYFTFPTTLTNTFQVRQATAGSAPRILGIKVWRDATNGFVVPTASTVLTPRAITGSITSTGFDGVELAHTIPLAVGLVLDTVSLNGSATTNFDANTGIVRIRPSGADIAVTHTTRVGATFNSPQIVSRRSGLSTNLTTTATNIDFGITLQEGDEILVFGDYANDSQQSNTVYVPYVKPGCSLRGVCWPAGDHVVGFNFPSTLTNIVPVNHAGGATSYRIRNIVVRRDAANKVCIPTATTVATTYTLTVNGGTNGTFTGYEGIGPETFYLTMPVDQEIDAFPTVAGVTLRNRQAGMVSVDRAIGAGNLALTGITFRAMAPNSQYFGTWNDQAGDSTATNGGHTCTRRLLRGSGITTSNDSLLTLSGGIYKVRAGIVRHFGANTWRNTILLVDGAQVENFFTGSDGSNWESGGGPIEWIVDASTVNRTVQVRRGGSTGNGNSAGYLSVERIVPVAAPDGVTLYSPRTISGTNVVIPGSRDNTVTSGTITGIATGSEVTAIAATGGATVLLRNSGRNGTAAFDIVVAGADSTVTYTTSLWQRTLTEASGALINGAASQSIDATIPYSSLIAIPAGQYLQTLTATNATVNRFVETGAFTINPTNAGNVVLTATFATASATDFIHVFATADQTTGLAAGNPVLFSTPTVHNSAGCTFAAGIFTLPANKTFRLESQITWSQGSELIFRWRNITSNTLIGGAGEAQVGGRGNIASAVISTTQVTTVRLEILYNNAITNINGTDATYGRGSWAYIKEVDRIVFSAPTGTTLFTARSITGTGITPTQGRDNTDSAIEITGIPTGQEINTVTVTNAQVPVLIDRGRNGTAKIEITPNGGDPVVSYTLRTWQRTLTATVNGSAANVNGAASANIDATQSVSFSLTLPAAHVMTSAPTIAGGTLLSWAANGAGSILPSNAGSITITASSTQPGARSTYMLANAGTWVDFGTIGVMIPTSGNRSLQIHSTSGTIVINYTTWLGWDGSRAPTAGVSINTASTTYLESGWNFTGAGNSHQAIIHDTTNNRRYRVNCMINASYNNCHFVVEEIT